MTQHKWQFATRFRRHAFGRRSEQPIQRIKEAVAEIKAVAKTDPALAAEGAVKLLEKLSPALEQVDSSSGAIGGAVNRAIETLVPLVALANVDRRTRQRWLDRLWEAIREDQIPYLDALGDYWGDLCGTGDLASTWADEFLPTLQRVWSPESSPRGYFPGTTACLSALVRAGRYDELMAVLSLARVKSWTYRQWGVRALVAQGRKQEALQYAEASRSAATPECAIARACEDILLSSGLAEEAYRRYAIEANTANTNLNTFRAIARKYPHKPQEDVLRDLVASQPGNAGKWFAAAKDAGLYDLAIELANTSPTDHHTLVRAAREHAPARPGFAVDCGLTALRWISLGHGWELTGTDVLEAYSTVLQAAPGANLDLEMVQSRVRNLSAGDSPGARLLRTVLGA